jgi:hypothetical protein
VTDGHLTEQTPTLVAQSASRHAPQSQSSSTLHERATQLRSPNFSVRHVVFDGQSASLAQSLGPAFGGSGLVHCPASPSSQST